ncbi:hypothetical protein X802_00750 [Thermococcus guaymasensis DSM 11113]|uniref:Uncharacterized protein n=1 Tax=Thermococcus guaymasensis DSM 11113 TaxID=1432656 RepID=A0A0X1KMZ0_9EURY|nr:hypothetical protein X802_00750 [Thermococcus guaymasensis DSM 11113]
MEPTPRDSGFHIVELLGERFKIFCWKNEKFTE